MRIIRTFILRLLIDPDEPEALRGSLQPVPEGEAQLFADEGALLAALRKAVLAAQQERSLGTNQRADRTGGEIP